MALTRSPSVVVVERGTARAEQRDGLTVVRLRGEHDVSTRGELARTLARAIAVAPNDVEVDLSEVQFLGASTIGVVVAAHEFLRARSRKLILRSPPAFARRILDICGLSDLVEPDLIDVIGPGAALGTWVQVPATQRVDQSDQRTPMEPDRMSASTRTSRAAATEPQPRLTDARHQPNDATVAAAGRT